MNKSITLGFRSFKTITTLNDELLGTYWYPTYDPGQSTLFSRLFQIIACEQATPAFQKMPLILISHGSGGTQYDQLYLINALVQQGYCVASIQHSSQHQRSNLMELMSRAIELNEIYDYLKQTIPSEQINFDSIATIGFSAGGFASLLLHGIHPNFEYDDSFHPYLHLLKEIDFNKIALESIQASILLAPALLHLFSNDSLTQIQKPILLLTAQADEVIHNDISRFHLMPGLKEYVELAEAGHYVFNQSYPPIMKKIHPTICADKSIAREKQHPLIITKCISFLKNHFRVNAHESC